MPSAILFASPGFSPAGRKKIARRFIGGVTVLQPVQSRRGRKSLPREWPESMRILKHQPGQWHCRGVTSEISQTRQCLVMPQIKIHPAGTMEISSIDPINHPSRDGPCSHVCQEFRLTPRIMPLLFPTTATSAPMAPRPNPRAEGNQCERILELEPPFRCFVPKQNHAQQAAGPPPGRPEDHEPGFGNPASATRRAPFVVAKKQQRHRIDGGQPKGDHGIRIFNLRLILAFFPGLCAPFLNRISFNESTAGFARAVLKQPAAWQGFPSRRAKSICVENRTCFPTRPAPWHRDEPAAT